MFPTSNIEQQIAVEKEQITYVFWETNSHEH